MQSNTKKYSIYIFTFFLLFVAIYLIILDFRNLHKEFVFAVLDVGQGDAIFIESKTGTQILVDGGPPKKILNELSRVMPPFDKSIDAIFITNPDQDHIGGILDILKYYEVGQVFESGTTSDSKIYQNLKLELKNKNVERVLVKKGMVIDLGDSLKMNILFPDRDVSSWSTNDGSIVSRLSYGNTSIMLTGDASIKTEKMIIENNLKENLVSTFLKVGHHGSRSATSDDFLKKVSPKYALISDGKNNKYGHPHKEVLDLLAQFKVDILRTDELGTIFIKCDNMKVCNPVIN
jgi:competence protein ComEC